MIKNLKQLEENYNKLLDFISNTFTGDRKEGLLKLYNDLGERAILAPASPRIHYHNAYPGGYIDHIFHVIENAEALHYFLSSKINKVDFTDEERNFSALNHDLGKLGDFDCEYYREEDNEWKLKQGSLYNINRNITNMSVTDSNRQVTIYVTIQGHSNDPKGMDFN